MSKYQSRSDPLELLRNAYANKKFKIKLKGKDLYFEKQAKLNLKTETPWMSPQTKKRYNLGSIWLFLEHHFKAIPTSGQYLQKISEYQLEAVNIADKDEIVKYFTGEINQSTYINQDLKLQLSQNRKRDNPAAGFDMNEEGLVKKIKGQQNANFDLQVIEYLMNFERPTFSKSKRMIYPNKSFETILTKVSQFQQKMQNVQSTGTKYRIMNIIEKKKLPIIIIPEKTQLGNITLGNVQKFLLKNWFDENAELQNSWASKIQITKELRGRPITFSVTNRPNLVLERDWDCVVAIFVQGRENQFQGWYKESPKAIFESIPGFFVRYVKTSTYFSQDWKVKNLILQKNTRYGDKQIVDTIWNDIENYIFKRI